MRQAKTVQLVNLPSVPYSQALELQHRLVAARRQGQVPDTLLLLEHPPVFTLGRHGKEEHILASRELLDAMGIGVFRVERGGDVTYHGPRQLVGYPILDLRSYGGEAGWYVHRLEDVLIASLRDFDLNARRLGEGDEKRDPKLVGVWIDNPAVEPLMRRVQPDAKVAQIGARIEQWITFHGFALNVDPNMEHFQLIVPCGITDKPVTSMAQALGHPVNMDEVRARVAQHFGELFAAHIEEISPEELEVQLPAVAGVVG